MNRPGTAPSPRPAPPQAAPPRAAPLPAAPHGEAPLPAPPPSRRALTPQRRSGLAARVTPYGLARRSVGSPVLWLMGVSASAPMTVLAGGVVATYASTGIVAVPLSFPLLAAALWLFGIGYTRMSAALPHAAPFSAVLTHGLGRTVGTAGAAVAVLSYNAVQLALYGLLGATAAGQLGGPWWAWAGVAWLGVAVIGFRGLTLGAVVIGVVLVCELGLIALFDITALTHPAVDSSAAWLAPWRPDLLAVDGVGGVIAFGVAGFLGFETTAAYAEEARTERSVGRATTASLAFMGIFYAVSAWALAVAVGPEHIAAVAQDPNSGIPFSILGSDLGVFGGLAATAGLVLLVLSMLGAMIALHQAVARYLYAVAREHVLPARLATILPPGGQWRRPRRVVQLVSATGEVEGERTRRGGVPKAASAAQSLFALVVIAIAAAIGADPVATVFTGLATLSALGLLTLMAATCIAVITYYRSGRSVGLGLGGNGDSDGPSWWIRVGAPSLGAIALAGALAVTVANLGPTLADPSGVAPVVLPVVVVVTALAGVGRASWLRRHNGLAYAAIGHGQPLPLAVRDHAVADLEL